MFFYIPLLDLPCSKEGKMVNKLQHNQTKLEILKYDKLLFLSFFKFTVQVYHLQALNYSP